MFQKNTKNGILYYTSSLLSEAGFSHAFFSRYGGVSTGVFSSLNVSTARKDADGRCDEPANVVENYRRALAVLETTPQHAVAAKQVHSGDVYCITNKDGGCGILPCYASHACDGLLLMPETDGVDAVCIKTADCVPILLVNRKTGAVCAVHAGWRGSAADIVTNAVKGLCGGHPENVLAGIGPCIGKCCYEIGEEVYGAFRVLFGQKKSDFDISALFPIPPTCSLGGKRHADLAGVNQALLMLCGVPVENIDLSGICTCCTRENGEQSFFSHRASGGFSGTFLSVVRVKH